MLAALFLAILTSAAVCGALHLWWCRKPGWVQRRDDSGGEHLLPARDAIEHDRTDECVCGPEVIPIQADDGEITWLYRHHSLDGRERRGAVAQ